MEVRATAQGYYDLKIRNEGDAFTIRSEKEFSSVWMEKIDGQARAGKPAAKSTKKAGPKEFHNEAMEKAIDQKADVI